MNFIKKVADRYPHLWRTLEISIISSLISGVITLLEAIRAFFINWATIDYQLILALFIGSLVTGITAGLTKRLRDEQKKIDPDEIVMNVEMPDMEKKEIQEIA